MKKTYTQPTIRVVTLGVRSVLLTGSPFYTVPIVDDEGAEFI